MPTEILVDDNYAVEESTVKLTITFTDENDDAATPTSINWTLTDGDGDIINSRDEVAVDVPASSIVLALTGDDLAIQPGETGEFVKRIFTLKAVYSSDLGSDLPLVDSLTFPLKNEVAVS